jgi:outer membrane lipoprotein-sorting protein
LTLAPRAACALLLLSLAACKTFSGGPPPFAPVQGEDERIHAWLDAAKLDASTRQGVRASGTLHVASPRGSGSTQEVVLAERPARLRFESLNMLGQASSLLVSDGERFAFFDGKKLEQGAAQSDVLRERLGLALEPGEAVMALLAAPLASDWPPREILGRGATRQLRGERESLIFGVDGQLAAIAALDEKGDVRWQVEYTDWRDVPGGRYPFRLVLSFPETHLEARLDLSQVELNPALDPGLFRVASGATP